MSVVYQLIASTLMVIVQNKPLCFENKLKLCLNVVDYYVSYGEIKIVVCCFKIRKYSFEIDEIRLLDTD